MCMNYSWNTASGKSSAEKPREKNGQQPYYHPVIAVQIGQDLFSIPNIARTRAQRNCKQHPDYGIMIIEAMWGSWMEKSISAEARWKVAALRAHSGVGYLVWATFSPHCLRKWRVLFVVCMCAIGGNHCTFIVSIGRATPTHLLAIKNVPRQWLYHLSAIQNRLCRELSQANEPLCFKVCKVLPETNNQRKKCSIG